MAIVTAGGPVFLAVDVLERSTGYRPDGIGLIVPGLVVTALTVFLVGIAFLCVFVRSDGRTPRGRARGGSGIAILPVLLTGWTAVIGVRYLSSQVSIGALFVWLDTALAAAVLFAGACGAFVVAAVVRRASSRLVALGLAVAALVAAAVAQPYLVSGVVLSVSLAICAGLLSLDREQPEPAP